MVVKAVSHLSSVVEDSVLDEQEMGLLRPERHIRVKRSDHPRASRGQILDTNFSSGERTSVPRPTRKIRRRTPPTKRDRSDTNM